MVAITGYEVRVESYRGPLDLLLFLIKDEEVDIYDIPIAQILGRYLAELAGLESVDINAAADFLLMAATLMEIKSRQMLPPEEREALDLEEEDPRADLVRQLLEYRRFRQAADELGVMAARRAGLFGRARFAQGLLIEDEAATDPTEELREVEVFDLLAGFESLMKAILADVPRTIIYDDISVEERIEELIIHLREEGKARFSDFVARAADRADAAGIFAAVLEATRRKLVTIYQPEPLGELYVSLRGESTDHDLAPSPEEQPRELSGKEMVARRGTFKGFMDVEEEEDLEFAFDVDGRKAIGRLDEAVRRAEEAIQGFIKPKPREPEPGPAVHQWTGEPGGADGAAAAPGASPAPGFKEAQKVVVRQWTDPDRRGQVITIGGQATGPPGPLRPLGFGRSIQPRRLARGRMLPRRIAASALPRRRGGQR